MVDSEIRSEDLGLKSVKEILKPSGDRLRNVYYKLFKKRKVNQEQNIRLADSINVRTNEIQRENENLKLESVSDQLTGLKNAKGFEDSLQDGLRRLRRQESRQPNSERGVAVIYIDLAGFKQINDLIGHERGDNVLKIFASELHDAFREEDSVARLHGDEFAVGLEGVVIQGLLVRLFGLDEAIRRMVDMGINTSGVREGYSSAPESLGLIHEVRSKVRQSGEFNGIEGFDLAVGVSFINGQDERLEDVATCSQQLIHQADIDMNKDKRLRNLGR